MKENQQFVKASIAAVIIAAIICVFMILAGREMGEFGAKLYIISFSLIFYGITATLGLVVSEKPDYKGLGNATAIVSVLGFLMIVILVLGDFDNPGMSTIKFTFSLMIASIALAHISLLHHFRLQNRYAYNARTTATVFISVFSLVLIILIFGDIEELQYTMMSNTQTIGKLISCSLIIDLAATVLVPLCNRLKTDEPVEFSFSQEEEPQQPQQPQPLQPVSGTEEQATSVPENDDTNSNP